FLIFSEDADLTDVTSFPTRRSSDLVATAGDVDGDGRADLLIGDAANNRVFLLMGRAQPFGHEYVLDGKPAPGQAVFTAAGIRQRSEEHTSELQSRGHLVCRLLLEKK